MCSELGCESLVSVLSPHFLSWALTSLGFWISLLQNGGSHSHPSPSFLQGREGRTGELPAMNALRSQAEVGREIKAGYSVLLGYSLGTPCLNESGNLLLSSQKEGWEEAPGACISQTSPGPGWAAISPPGLPGRAKACLWGDLVPFLGLW